MIRELVAITLGEALDAFDGVTPAPRPCLDATDLAFWFMCVSKALEVRRLRARRRRYVVIEVRDTGKIRSVSTTVRVNVEGDAARRGRLTPDVRR